jgi:hypothetical protein
MDDPYSRCFDLFHYFEHLSEPELPAYPAPLV